MTVLACIFMSNKYAQLEEIKLDKNGLRFNEALIIVPKNIHDRGKNYVNAKFTESPVIVESDIFYKINNVGVDENELRSDEFLAIISNENYQKNSDSTMILISSESYHKTHEQDIIIRDDELLVIRSKEDYSQK